MKVLSVRKLKDIEFTVDIEVEDTHSYQLDNGCVSHNTVSQLVDSASGLHDRFAEFYIRRVRGDKKDPLCTFMRDAGFPCEDDVTNPSNVVFAFPMKSPTQVNKDHSSAIEQLEHWKTFKDHWCEHSASVTIYYSDDEFLGVGQWVWDNFDSISGISFLPRSDHAYQQAPYEEIDESKWESLVRAMPQGVEWSGLIKYELEDTTTGTQALACTGTVCEMVDIGS